MGVGRLYFISTAFLFTFAYGLYDGLINWRIPVLEITICICLVCLFVMYYRVIRNYYQRKSYVDNVDTIDESSDNTNIYL